MKKTKFTFSVLLLIFSISISGQSLQVQTNGSIHLFKTGIQALYLGNYSNTVDKDPNGVPYNNGEWEIDTNGNRYDPNEDGSLNIGKPWPSPYFGNYYLFFSRNGNVAIGKKCPTYKFEVQGDVAISGTLLVTSDKRLKSNISSLKDDKIKGIYKLNGKSYNKTFPSHENETNRHNGVIPDSIFEKMKKSRKLEKPREMEFGFLAQDLKEVYPNLVKTDSTGYYYVDYIGLIPVIVEALKDQKVKIEQQQTEMDSLKQELTNLQTCCNSNKLKNAQISDSESASEAKSTDQALLYQNSPNPFNQSTEIKYYLPNSASKASLIFYDMQGSQLKVITISTRGIGSQIISASEFNAGMYLYALLVDGKAIDVKRMILTK